MEKLDVHSKIMLATSAINHLSGTMFKVNEQIRQVAFRRPEDKQIFQNGIEYRDKVLEDAIARLIIIMEEMGQCMSNDDSVCAIDVRITKPAFDILIHGKDNVEK